MVIQRETGLTGNTSKKLASKALYLAARERYKLIAFEKVKDTLSKEIRDNAYMIPEVEAIS